MAKSNLRLAENINGDFYVDSSCVDCDTCHWMTPEVFNRAAGQSVVITSQQMKPRGCRVCKRS